MVPAGEEATSFLAENVHLLKEGGEILCLASGPDATFLGQRGFRVTAIDDPLRLQFFDFGSSRWDAIVSIQAGIARDRRVPIHRACVEALKMGGVFVLEDVAAKLTKADVLEELSGLHVTHATESRGVVRLLGRRPT